MKIDKGFKYNGFICLKKGEPSSKPKYDIQAIANSTVKEQLN